MLKLSCKKGLVLFIALLFIGTTTMVTPVLSSNAVISQSIMGQRSVLYVGGVGPNNYTTIQDALDDALEGDTIFVYNGMYNESIVVSTNALTLMGEDEENTIINGTGIVDTVLVDQADDLVLTGFTVTCGLVNGNDSVFAGVNISKSVGVEIFGNNINNNYDGIMMSYANLNIVYENTIESNYNFAIRIVFSDDNIFENNTISHHSAGNIVISECDRNQIKYNFISDSEVGIFLMLTDFTSINHNTITNNVVGIYFVATRETLVTHNNISDNDNSLLFEYALFDQIFNNNIKGLERVSVEAYFSLVFAQNNYWYQEFLSLPHRQIRPVFAWVFIFPWKNKPFNL